MSMLQDDVLEWVCPECGDHHATSEPDEVLQCSWCEAKFSREFLESIQEKDEEETE